MLATDDAIHRFAICDVKLVTPEGDDFMASRQLAREFGADEAARSGDYNLHLTLFCSSLKIRLAFTSSHSSSMMLKRTESRVRPFRRIRCLRRMPSCFAPKRSMA